MDWMSNEEAIAYAKRELEKVKKPKEAKKK